MNSRRKKTFGQNPWHPHKKHGGTANIQIANESEFDYESDSRQVSIKTNGKVRRI